ncbi:MAG: leucine-rich repeat protein [Lachnospiraceae bacterium]|nr:leucine-rich repeat protein [Lachnospiraceae bacterium]
MKEMKNRNMYSQITQKYIRKHYCFKRACTLLMSLLIFITSDSNIWQVLTVSAAESRSGERVITSFSPLPLEVSEQIVYVGTPIEELELPDTLEAICSYKGNNEDDSSDDNDKTKEDDKITDDTDDTDDADDTSGSDNTGDADDKDDTGDSEDSNTPDDDSGKDDGKGDNSNDDKSGTENEKGDESGDNNDDSVPGKDDGSTGTDVDTGDKKDGDDSGDGEQNGNGEQKGDETGSGTTDAEDKADAPADETDNGANEATENSGTVTDNSGNNQTTDTSDRSDGEQFNSEKGAVSGENASKEAVVSNAVDVQLSSNKVLHKFGITVAAVIAKSSVILSPEIFGDNNFGRLYSLSTGDVHILGDGQSENESGSENITESNTESETRALTETVIIEGVTWECTSEYDSETPDCYVFTPVLPDGLLLADDVVLPDIIVIVEEESVEPEFMEEISLFASLADIKSGNCGANLTWEYDNGTLTISGTGAMDDFETSGAPWAHYADDIENIEIGTGVTSIGMYAFYGCSKVGSLQLPGNVTSIGKYAFYECSSLSSIGIPDSVASIGEHAFSDCYSLVSVSMPSGIEEISNSMFSGCTSLQSVDIPSSITNIGMFSFSGCTSLQSVTIPNGVTTIGILAFSNCTALGIIEIPDSVQNVTAYSFRNCSNAVLYYSDNLPAADNLAAIKSVKANIKYAITGDGVKLELVGIGSGVSTIELPATVHGGVVVSANWADYPNVKITHPGDHKYDEDGFCAICGEENESELEPEPTPEAGIDYVDEMLINLIGGALYLIDGDEPAADSDGKIAIDEYWFDSTISIVKQGDGETTGDSDEQLLDIPARPDAPEGIDSEDESAEGANDGKITGVNNTMVYQKEGDSSWKAVTGNTISGLEPGTYYVCYKAIAGQSFRSEPEEITINEYEPEIELKPETQPAANIDYVNELLTDLIPGAEYLIAGETKKASAKGTIDIKADWIGSTISIVKTGNGTTTSNSEEQELAIKSRPSAPTGVKGEDESKDGPNDGKLTNVSDEMEYCLVGSDDWEDITGITVNNLSPGAYYVRIRAIEGQSFHSDSIKVIINAYKPETELQLEETPNAGIDYVDEFLTGLIPGAKYLIDLEEKTATAKGTIKIDENWFDDKISIIKVGNGTTTDDSEEQLLEIKARPSAPTGVTGEDESREGGNNGKLTGVSNEMEYCLAGSGDWKGISGTKVNNLPPGTYYVRIKAVAGESFHSENIKVIINAYKPETELPLEETPDAGIDYIDEFLTGLIPGTEYLIYGETKKATGKGTIKIEEHWFGDTISIIKAGDGITKNDSKEQLLDIPARPSVPAGVKGVDESVENANDGKLTGVSSKMEYCPAGSGDWKEISGTTVNNLSPGAYNIRVKAVKGQSFHSDSIKVIINACKPETELPLEKSPTAVIDYINELLTGLTPGAEYLIDWEEINASAQGTIKIDESWFGDTISIVKPGDGITTDDSEEQLLDIPERPSAPAGVKGVDESAENANNGQLTGVNSKMEYCPAGSGDWKGISRTTVNNLSPGAYYVRIKAVAGQSFHSDSIKVIINAYKPETELPLEKTPNARIDYEKELLTNLISGAEYLIDWEERTASGEGFIEGKGTIEIEEYWFDDTISIIKVGDGTTTDDSVEQPLDIPARPAAPTGVKGVDESAEGAENGKITGVNNTMVYQMEGESSWKPVIGNTISGLKPGTYYVCYKAIAGQSFRSEPEEITIYEYEPEPGKTPADKPEARIDYVNETLTGLISGADYLINDKETTKNSDGTITISESWLGRPISIVRKGNGTTTINSDAQQFTIPARPAAPTGIGKVDESGKGKNDGKITGVTTGMEYQAKGKTSWEAVAGTTIINLAPGTYYVRTKAVADQSFHSDYKEITINAYELKLTPEKTPIAKIDYVNEKLTGFISGADYLINDKEATKESDGTIIISEGWLGSEIRIVKKGNGTTTSDSVEQPLKIPARPAAPTGLGKTDETAEGAKNGKITGVKTSMEYQAEGASSWKAVPGTTINNLAPGTYYVRTKAVANKSFHSDAVKITINAYVKLDPEETPTAEIDYVNEKLTGLISGADYLINKEKIAANSKGEIDIEEVWMNNKAVSIIRKGDGTTKGDSEPQSLTIPARPSAPKGIEKEDESHLGAEDGKITNLNTDMEYQKRGASEWTPVSGTTLTPLVPGTYYIRTKAVEGEKFHSDNAEIIIEEYELKPEDTPKASIDYEAETIIDLIAGAAYTIDGDKITGGIIDIRKDWFGNTIYIKKIGNGTTTKDSAPQKLVIKRRPSAPKGTGKTDETEAKNDGTLTGVNNKMEYRKEGADSWTKVEGTTVEGLSPGKYEIRYSATKSEFASEIVTQVISSFNMVQEEMEPVSIDYINETLKIFKPGAEYYIDGESVTAEAGGVIKIREEWFNSNISIVKAGDMIDTYDSEPQNINIPARPDAPTEVGTEDESANGANDGKLVNLDSSMEYQREGADEWTPVTGTTSKSLAPGIYLVRIKATDESFCSESESYIIRAYALSPESMPDAEINFFEETLIGLTKNSAYKVSIASAKPGAGDEIYVEADGNIEIKSQWFGRTLNIIKMGDDIITTDSVAQVIDIPARPDAPTDVEAVKESYKNARDGQLTNVDSDMQYRNEIDSAWKDIDDIIVEPLPPGNYLIRIKATSSSFCSESVTRVISGYELEKEDMPDVGIYYLGECFENLEPEEVYIINGVVLQADENGEIPINSIWMKGKNVSIIKKGNGHSTTNSNAQTIKVPKRPSAPKGITAVSESAEDENDGKLTGVNEKMEYCLKGSDEWIQIDEDMVEGLEPGTYEIRYMATENSFASASVTKTVYAYGTKAPNKGTSNNTQPDGENSLDDTENNDIIGVSDNIGSSDNKSAQPGSNTNEVSEDGTSEDAFSPNQDDYGIYDADASEIDLESSETEPEQEDNAELSETEDDIFYIPSIVDEEKIVPKSEDNAWEEAYNNGFRKVFFILEHGGVLLNINNIDESVCKANIPDVVAAANAILTTQEIVQSNKGDIVEIRIDIKCIDDSVQIADIELIEQGIDDCNNESLALDTGMYVDISVFKRAEGYEWEPVNALNMPIEVRLYIPDPIKTLSHEFYVLRVHGGEYKLLNDMDDNADTITVQTHLFSTYALLYKLDDANLYAEDEMNGKQGIYSIVKTFLEKGGLIWLAVILAEIIIIILIVAHVKNKKKKGSESLPEN